MSQSSCPSLSPQEVKEGREKDIEDKATAFLRQVVQNMCVPEGINGRFDLAFKINRRQIIARVLKQLSKELEDESSL